MVAATTVPPPVERAGRAGARLGKVPELTVIVPLVPGGAKLLRAFLRLLRDNLSQGADKVGTLHSMSCRGIVGALMMGSIAP